MQTTAIGGQKGVRERPRVRRVVGWRCGCVAERVSRATVVWRSEKMQDARCPTLLRLLLGPRASLLRPGVQRGAGVATPHLTIYLEA